MTDAVEDQREGDALGRATGLLDSFFSTFHNFSSFIISTIFKLWHAPNNCAAFQLWFMVNATLAIPTREGTISLGRLAICKLS